MMTQIELEEYLSKGTMQVVKGIMTASMKNPKASLFMIQHGIDSKRASKKRAQAEKSGEHIPPFLIASITEQCNLHCKGCYARAVQGCKEACSASKVLTAPQWNEIFSQAEELGVEFILLAGGEPFGREDVLEAAGKHPSMLFPIFTNGTMIDEKYLLLLNEKRNLLPVLSIEGSKETTDARRGSGIYQKLVNIMDSLKKNGIVFGASITVTKANRNEVLSAVFVQSLQTAGAKAVVFVEFVPMDETDRPLAPDDNDRILIRGAIDGLRKKFKQMVFIAFPGDEKTSGGCLAAGRGFFHINSHGGAEPCPFSPYSDTNIMETSLKDALRSPLFQALSDNKNLTKEHIGGCVLFEQRKQVEALLEENMKCSV